MTKTTTTTTAIIIDFKIRWDIVGNKKNNNNNKWKKNNSQEYESSMNWWIFPILFIHRLWKHLNIWTMTFFDDDDSVRIVFERMRNNEKTKICKNIYRNKKKERCEKKIVSNSNKIIICVLVGEVKWNEINWWWWWW